MQKFSSHPIPEGLYERIGGEAGIASFVDEFYERVLADSELSPFFKGVSVEKLQHMQREFFAAAAGGPVIYSGRPLGQVHAGLGITRWHMKRFIDHLIDVLREHRQLHEDDVKSIVARVGLYAEEVTGDGPLLQ